MQALLQQKSTDNPQSVMCTWHRARTICQPFWVFDNHRLFLSVVIRGCCFHRTLSGSFVLRVLCSLPLSGIIPNTFIFSPFPPTFEGVLRGFCIPITRHPFSHRVIPAQLNVTEQRSWTVTEGKAALKIMGNTKNCFLTWSLFCKGTSHCQAWSGVQNPASVWRRNKKGGRAGGGWGEFRREESGF